MTTPASTIGQEFAHALLTKNWSRLEFLLDNDISFRGLTPGQSWQASSPQELIENVFTQWFEPTDEIYEILDISSDVLGDRRRVIYRFKVRNPEGDYLVEQTAYFFDAEEKITKLRILCSGFIPTS